MTITCFLQPKDAIIRKNPLGDYGKYKRKLHYSHTIVKDVQRVFACLAMNQNGGTDDLAYVAAMGKAAGFSSRIVNAMSAQPAWRWGKRVGRKTLSLMT